MAEVQAQETLLDEIFSRAEKDDVTLEFVWPKPIYLGEVDFEGIENFDKTMILMAIRHIVSYLKKPIVKDNFKNHDQRRAWRASLPDHLRDLLKENKLKKSQITIPYSALSSIIRYGEKYPQFSEAVKTAKQLLPEIVTWTGGLSGEVDDIDIVERYDLHTPEEKAAFIKKLDEALKVILKQLETGST